MPIRMLLKRNTYYDSIALMSIARTLKDLPGVEDVGAVMATTLNRELLAHSRLLPTPSPENAEMEPGPEDLLIVVRAGTEAQTEAALTFAERILVKRQESKHPTDTAAPAARSLEMALRRDEQAQLAVISVAGQYAWLEAEQALRHGLHVFLFSDNVTIEQERRLKALATSQGRLLMGPDCGTALLNGVGLGFCNIVPRGSIGIVGASGTGMQQVMCQIAAAGQGVSQAIGTGGRDLSEEIGGSTMRRGLRLLADDPDTRVIVLVSKPPARSVAQEILQLARMEKPVVVIFLGNPTASLSASDGNIHFAQTLTEGAQLAVALAEGSRVHDLNATQLQGDEARLSNERAQLVPAQRYIRALYSGGTLCDEAMLLLSERVGAIASNIPLQPAWALAAHETYRGHTALDLGADEFTQGRPHPMIDPSLCLPYLARAAEDIQTAVILLDIVLGFCAHPNPAAIFAPAISQARAKASVQGRTLPIIISLCGTEEDPQRLSLQRATLEAAGALVYESNATAALAAASFVPESK